MFACTMILLAADVVTGVAASQRLLGDMFQFSTVTFAWSKLSYDTDLPNPGLRRCCAAFSYDCVLLFMTSYFHRGHTLTLTPDGTYVLFGGFGTIGGAPMLMCS